MRYIKNQLGVPIPTNHITMGYITTDMDFPDYGLKIGENYPVKGKYPSIYANGQIRIDNNELRDDVLPHLTITI